MTRDGWSKPMRRWIFKTTRAVLALCLLWSHGCVNHEAGAEVSVVSSPPGGSSLQAFITVSAVWLVRCEPPNRFSQELRSLVFGAVARAHTEAGPYGLGAPFVLPWSADGAAPLHHGTITPPPGRYCGVRILFAPADGDAERLSLGGEGETFGVKFGEIWRRGTVRHEQTYPLDPPWEVNSASSLELLIRPAFDVHSLDATAPDGALVTFLSSHTVVRLDHE